MSNVKHLSLCTSLLAAFAGLATTAANAQSIVLDDFEAPSLFVVQPNTSGNGKYLWNLYLGSGAASLSTADKHDGNQSLLVTYTGGTEWQFQLYTYTEGLSGWGNDWQFMRKFVKNPTTWQTGHINRMKFWVKVPAGMSRDTGGNHNIEFGTYVRCSTCSGAEDRGGHFYHFLDIGTTGVWEQVIIDTHPDHIRGANGDQEHPDQIHPSGEAAFTYFDLVTRFYVHIPYQRVPQPANFYFDGFELYEETNPENVDQVRSVHASYNPTSNEVRVGWGRKKSEVSVKHEVRYSFSDIHAGGWDSATAAPSGTVTPPGDGGYNGMFWSSTALSLAGRTTLYVAIKPQNATTFRQIAIPISGAPPTAPVQTPNPPTGVSAQ